MNTKRKVANIFINDLQTRPDDMIDNDITITDTYTKRVWWISAYSNLFRLKDPFEVDVGWWHGMRCHRALKVWRSLQQRKDGTINKANKLADYVASLPEVYPPGWPTHHWDKM